MLFQDHNRVISLQVDGKSYEASPEDFAADLTTLKLPTYPGIPEGFITWRKTDKLNALYTSETQIAAPDLPQADAYIANIDLFIAESDKRKALSETPPASPATPTVDERGAQIADGLGILADLLFNQENRIRVLEGKAVITKGQYRQALIARWKILNP